MDKIFPLTTSSKPATVYSEHFSPSRVVLPKIPFLFCNTAKHSFFHVSCYFVFVAVFEMIKLSQFKGATAGPSVFSHWGLFKDQYSISVPFLHVCSGYGSLVCVVQRISSSVWFNVYGSIQLPLATVRIGTWHSELVHSTQCCIPFVVVFSVWIKDAHLSPSKTTVSVGSRLCSFE